MLCNRDNFIYFQDYIGATGTKAMILLKYSFFIDTLLCKQFNCL